MLLVFSYAFVLGGLVDLLGVLKSARRSEIAVGKRLAESLNATARGCGKPMRDIDGEHGAEVLHGFRALFFLTCNHHYIGYNKVSTYEIMFTG